MAYLENEIFRIFNLHEIFNIEHHYIRSMIKSLIHLTLPAGQDVGEEAPVVGQ